MGWGGYTQPNKAFAAKLHEMCGKTAENSAMLEIEKRRAKCEKG